MTPVKAIRVGVWFYKKDVTRMLCSLNVGIVPIKEIFSLYTNVNKIILIDFFNFNWHFKRTV